MVDMTTIMTPTTGLTPHMLGYENALPDNWFLEDSEIRFRVTLTWPQWYGLHSENINSIYELIRAMKRSFSLVDFGEEASFAHRWAVEEDGRENYIFKLECVSTMCEALADMMQMVPMYLLTPTDFKMEFHTVSGITPE